LYPCERCILNTHQTHRFSQQTCSEQHENLGRARIDENKNDYRTRDRQNRCDIKIAIGEDD
jgi:uncharacterized protein YcbX